MANNIVETLRIKLSKYGSLDSPYRIGAAKALEETIAEAVIEANKNPNDPDLLMAVVETIPYLCSFRITQRSTLDSFKLNTFFNILQKSEMLEHLKGVLGGEKSLAWLCMQRAAECEIFSITDKALQVQKVIALWLNRELPDPLNLTLESVVGVLYGGNKDMLPLLGFDLSYQLPNSLWLNNIPVLSGNVEVENTMFLPDTLDF